MKILACNIKNKMDKTSTQEYIKILEEIKSEKTELVIIPSLVHIALFQDTNYKVGSQDISSFIEETITGEITAKQLKALDVSYVIVGHSERRKYKHEINIDFINKINHAQECDLKVIYCIGETLEERERKETFSVLDRQISEVLNNVVLKDIIIAYEPVWAIGTGLIPEAKEIANTIEYIKDIIDEKYEQKIKVLYGGSVNVENIEVINNINCVDGFLVGGASLDATNVIKMLDIIEK